ncbi:PRC and DUF2382 domain-containing protein [Streptomyces montanisoli]|uniref:PRC and DUF2382 domain-containing protein n=1 Tax=Streptomyces montanisoli TaxID=2798581 RepID=A0A940MF43_9ACTN|nr:PRC and DUF2382 domain-containing protein [Streptomyces montanisoli]MBP0457503.1 PRC and DUF2382 domain-containing protein [Streptomyces montanisoli]
MITQAQIPAVLDHPVYDSGGNKIGSAKHVFYDDATGNPEWVTVKTGMFGSSESFIPTHDASLVQDHLEVPYGKDQIKDAPNVDIDAGGHLSEQEEHRLYKYYGLDGGLDDRQGGKHAKTGGGPDAKGGMAAMGGAGAVGAAGAAGTANRRDSAAEAGTAGRAGDMDDDAAMRQSRAAMAPSDASALDLDKEAMGRDTASRAPTSTARADDMTGAEDIAMTRSEEHMTVGTERHEAARARLHKYVVTEEEQQTIPVRHEEVRVIREPITAENRDAAMRGADISEADHEVTLHEERPVVEMHTEPVERVRLTTEEKVEQQTVTGTVRKERIEAETEAPDGTKGHVSGQDRGGRGGMPQS